jgi:hypothetical protein
MFVFNDIKSLLRENGSERNKVLVEDVNERADDDDGGGVVVMMMMTTMQVLLQKKYQYRTAYETDSVGRGKKTGKC